MLLTFFFVYVQIMCLFGTDAVREVACQYGKRLVCSEYRAPVNIQAMCR